MSLRSVLAIPASDVTDETVYRARRRLLGAFAGASLLPLAGCAEAEAPPSTAVVTPEQARSGFRTDEVQTRYEDITGYNNFYEFGTDKSDPSRAKKTLRTSPWNVAVSGECARPGNISFEDLLKGISQEERIYRLRCVEGWSMVIPWLGVPLGSGNRVIGGAKSQVSSVDNVRDGLMAVLEFKPNDSWHSILDLYYSRFDKSETLRFIESPLAWSGATLSNPVVENGMVVGGTFTGVRPGGSSSRIDTSRSP